jgi:hypothetical protein
MNKVMRIVETHQKIFDEMLAFSRESLLSWAIRIEQNFKIIQDSHQRAGQSAYVPAASAQQHIRLFSEPKSRLKTAYSRSAVSATTLRMLTSNNEIRDLMKHGIVSEFKATLLLDDMSVVARIAKARDKGTSGLMRAKPLIPQLNLNKATWTKDRLEALTSREARLFSGICPRRKSSPPLRCAWGGVAMTPGAWLTDRVSRNTGWLKSHLGDKFTESSQSSRMVQANLKKQGLFAEKAAQRVRENKDSWQEPSWKQDITVSKQAVSCFLDIDESTQESALQGQIDVHEHMMHKIIRETLPKLKHGGLRFLPRTRQRPMTPTFMSPAHKHLCAGSHIDASWLEPVPRKRSDSRLRRLQTLALGVH